MKPITSLLVTCFVLLSLYLPAQSITTTFTPATATGAVGTTVDLELKVTNFTNIISVQFPVTYNSAVLQFVSADNYALPGFGPANYNSLTGKVNVSWFADLGTTPNGVTLAAGTTLMRMRFQILGNGTATVNLANVAPGIEFVKSNGSTVTVSYASGGSTITGGNGQTPITGFHIIANGGNVNQGQKYCLPVTVNDFNNVISMQYAMHWNSTVLKFDSTRAYNLPFLTAANFGGNTSSGTLLLSWYDQNATGVSKPNGTKIYEVCFTGIGPANSQSLVTLDGVGFPGNPGAEIANTNGTNIWTSQVPINDTVFVVSAPPPANAPTFTADKDTVQMGSTTCVDIKVKNFTSILSTQFVLTYDVTKFTLQSVTFGSNPLGLSTGANFNTNTPGQIRFSWSDNNGTGVTKPDNTVIFSVCLTATGACGATAYPVNFTGITGFPVEVAQEPAGPVTPVLNNGHVVISCAPPPPQCAVSATNVSCFGGNNGAVNLTVTNPGNPSTFSWTGPNSFTAATEDLANLLPGTYTVTVTTAGGTCTSTATITQPASALNVPANQLAATAAKCFGGSDGLININVSGGTTPYTFDWSNDGPETPDNDVEDLLNVAAGSYTVTVTDANGCTATQTASVGQPSAPLAVALQGTTNVKCKGQPNGGACIAVSGGTQPYNTYVWKNAQNSTVSNQQCPTNFLAGSYFVTVTDANGCQAVLSTPAVVNEPGTALTGSTAPTNIQCPGASTGLITANGSGGWGSYTYAWSNSITGGTNPNLTAGTYTVTVTDQGGCSVTLPPVTLTAPSTISFTGLQVTNVNCAGQGNGAISLSPQGGNGAPYMINWSNGMSGASISNLNGGSYTPTIRDVQGCSTVMSAISLTEPLPISVSASITDQTGAVANGAVDLTVSGGITPYTFNWSNGPTNEDITGLNAGSYTVTVSDNNGCSTIETAAVEQTNVLIGSSIIAKADACSNNGSITINISAIATPPFTLDWGTGTVTNINTYNTTVSNLSPGVYNLTLSDAVGNTLSLPQQNIVSLAPATVSSQTSNPDCVNANGAIVLTPLPSSTPMFFQWNNGLAASALINIGPGTYTATVTNANSGCTANYTYTLTCPAPSTNGTSMQNANCTNTPNGSIDFAFSGGDGPNYNYLWSTGATTQDINSLLPGVYTVTVTDEAAATYTYSYNVGVNSQMAITNVNELSNHGGFQVSGAGICDGEASVVITGTPLNNVSILWSNGATSVNNTSLCGGTYSVTVTDNLGCTSIWSDELTTPPAIAAQSNAISNFNGYNISCNGKCDGIARVYVSGGVSPYTIQWPNGQVEEIDNAGDFSQATNLCGGTFQVTITDDNGVTSTKEVVLAEPEPLEISFANVAPSSFSRCDGEVIALVPGAVGNVNFNWSASITGQSGTGPQATDLCSGERIQYVAQDQNGCIVVGHDTVPYPEDGCLRVRPVLTPGQQDGKNDFMLITCIESVPNSVEIYNRWGQLVFETVGYNNDVNFWDGTKNGQPLPEGVYFYILNYTDDQGDHQQRGHVNLLR